MTRLPDFRLETYFSRWEFTARHHLTASDAQTMTLSELLTLADDQDRAAFANLPLSYTETHGDPALREAIAGMYERAGADDVICFAGAEEALYLAMNVLLDAGDHAVVVTPNYQAAETVPLALCEVTGVALDPDQDWALDLDAVQAAIRPNTRVVSVNFPNNPTGKVISAAEFTELARLCDERGIHLFSDEVYRGLELDAARTLPQAADLSERALSLNVTSKSLGLPGLRIGWITCRDRKLVSRLERAKHYTTICNSAPSEILARIAIKARAMILHHNRALIAHNLPLFDAFFAEHPDLFEWRAPDGGCVAFPRYLGPDGVEEFCTRLVEEAGVLLLPASIYHSELTPTPADRFRIGVGRAHPEEGLAAITEWLRENRRHHSSWTPPTSSAPTRCRARLSRPAPAHPVRTAERSAERTVRDAAGTMSRARSEQSDTRGEGLFDAVADMLDHCDAGGGLVFSGDHRPGGDGRTDTAPGRVISTTVAASTTSGRRHDSQTGRLR